MNHNRQLGIVREKVPEGTALPFSPGSRTAAKADASSPRRTSNPSALYVSSQRNSAFTVMISKRVKKHFKEQLYKSAGDYEDS